MYAHVHRETCAHAYMSLSMHVCVCAYTHAHTFKRAYFASMLNSEMVFGTETLADSAVVTAICIHGKMIFLYMFLLACMFVCVYVYETACLYRCTVV